MEIREAGKVAARAVGWQQAGRTHNAQGSQFPLGAKHAKQLPP